MVKKQLNKSKGFTLIELLIVIALSSVLFTLLFGTYFQLQKVIKKQNIRSQISQQAIEAMYVLSSDIHNLYYEQWNIDFYFLGEKKIVENQQIDTLKFPTSSLYSNTSTLQASVYTVTYFGGVDEETNETILYRKEDSFLDYKGKTLELDSNNDVIQDGVAIPLLKNVKNFIIEYSNNYESYDDTWDITKSNIPPKFIRVTLEWEENGLIRKITSVMSPVILSH